MDMINLFTYSLPGQISQAYVLQSLGLNRTVRSSKAVYCQTQIAQSAVENWTVLVSNLPLCSTKWFYLTEPRLRYSPEKLVGLVTRICYIYKPARTRIEY